MINTPLISVIVPVYNVAEYLPKCVDSILAQSYSHLEIILVDDGSTDESGRICDEYSKNDSRVKTIHKANGGLSDARNVGIEASSGDYIMFVDSDDLIHYRFVETLLGLSLDHKAGIASVEFKSFYEESDLDLSEAFDGKVMVFSSEESIERVLYQNVLDNSVCNKIYARDVIGNLRFPIGKLYEDMAICYRLMERTSKVAHKQVPLYYYRLRKDSITGNFSFRRADVLDITDEIVDYAKQHRPSLIAAACDRKFAANMNILWLMTSSKTVSAELELRCWENIRMLRLRTLINPKSRLKNRVGALLAMFGKKIMKLIFRLKRHSR